MTPRDAVNAPIPVWDLRAFIPAVRIAGCSGSALFSLKVGKIGDLWVWATATA